MQMAQMINMMQNPNQMINSLIQSNPAMQRAIEMTKGKTPEEIEQVCRNVCEQKGINYDEAFQQFQRLGSQFGINP